MSRLPSAERARLAAALEAQAVVLEALRDQVEALTAAVEALTRSDGAPLPFEDASSPVGAAPLAAGGGAVYPGFPTAFRTRSGGAR